MLFDIFIGLANKLIGIDERGHGSQDPLAILR